MTRVLSGTIDPSDDDYQPPLSVTLQSVDTKGSFLELDVYKGGVGKRRHGDTCLISAALWHDLGMAEGWTSADMHFRGAETFISCAFSLRFVPDTTVRFFGEWHRDNSGIERCMRAEATAVSLGATTRSYERFLLVLGL